MKRFVVVMILALFGLQLASTAWAGGPPPKDMLKGIFIEMDAASGTVTFVKDGETAPKTLSFGTLTAEDIPLHKKVMVSLDKHVGDNVIKDISVMFMEMTLAKIIALMVVGLIGGLLSGFIGSGGAFVLTPAMMSLGAPGAVAVASNMCHKFPKAMVGTYKRFKYGQVDLKLAGIMSVTAIIGVQIGIIIQKYILNHWGNAGSNLYVSIIFVIVLVLVGGYVCYDAYKLSQGAKAGNDDGYQVSPLAQKLMKINLPPMIHFKVAKVTISVWITVPVGLATGMLAATIAVGGFIGVPGMIYVIGASAVVASATELGIAFIMGAWGSIQWAISGLVDIRMTLLILSMSLIGVQLGALGTTYVKDYMIKIVMASTMLIVAVSRGAKVPAYLIDLGWMDPMSPGALSVLNSISFWSLITALATAGTIIVVAMVKGMTADRRERRTNEVVNHG